MHLHETLRQNSIQQGLPIPQKNSPPGVSRGLRRYSCRSWPLDTYSRMSSTRQFRIRQRSLRVVVVMGLLFRSLSMVELERWWYLTVERFPERCVDNHADAKKYASFYFRWVLLNIAVIETNLNEIEIPLSVCYNISVAQLPDQLLLVCRKAWENTFPPGEAIGRCRASVTSYNLPPQPRSRGPKDAG